MEENSNNILVKNYFFLKNYVTSEGAVSCNGNYQQRPVPLKPTYCVHVGQPFMLNKIFLHALSSQMPNILPVLFMTSMFLSVIHFSIIQFICMTITHCFKPALF